MSMRKLVIAVMVAAAAVVLGGCHFGLGHHNGHHGYHNGYHADMHHHYDYHGAAAYCHYCYH